MRWDNLTVHHHSPLDYIILGIDWMCHMPICYRVTQVKSSFFKWILLIYWSIYLGNKSQRNIWYVLGYIEYFEHQYVCISIIGLFLIPRHSNAASNEPWTPRNAIFGSTDAKFANLGKIFLEREPKEKNYHIIYWLLTKWKM